MMTFFQRLFALIRAKQIEIDAERVPFVGPLSHIPTTRNEVVSVFGHPGFSKKDPDFKRRLGTFKGLPGSWSSGRKPRAPNPSPKLYMHKLMAPYLIEALARAHENGSLAAVRNIGCYSYRHQQHNPQLPLSYHSWGIAVDVDQAHNRVVRFGPGRKPEPWSDAWLEHWPQGVSRGFVEAMEGVGFLWGGRWKHFVDPMHFQLVR